MLNIKQKWDIEAQLGEMLREAEKPAHDPEKEFETRLFALVNEYGVSLKDAAAIASTMLE